MIQSVGTPLNTPETAVGGVKLLNLIKPKPLQLNALLPIVVTLFGIVIEARVLQLKNEYSPIVVTVFGIVIEERQLQPWNI